MRHTRMAALTLSLVTLLTTLCGCHGSRSQNAFTVPDSFDESRQYEITFWAKNDTNKTQVDIYSKAIADFQALYPNITVKLRLYTDYGKIYNDVITNIATNTTPNVCITYPDHIATYLTGDNVVAPLDALFADEQYGLGGSALRYDGPASEEMISRFLEECSFSGSHYAVPFMRSTEACYVNRTYVEALGYELPEMLTWDFVWEVSEAAAAAKNADGTYTVNGQQVLLPFIYKSTDNMMIQLLRQKNAGYSTDSGDVQIFNDTTEDILYDVARHTASGAFSTFKISGYPANFLNAGQCLFAVDSTAGATWMGSHAPLSDISADKYVDFETAVMAVPQCDPDHPQMISQGPSVCAGLVAVRPVSADQRRPDRLRPDGGLCPRHRQGPAVCGISGLSLPRRRGRFSLLRRKDPGIPAAAEQRGQHVHHASLQRLHLPAQRRGPAH